MPIVGRNRKATPLAVWEVFRDKCVGSFIDAFPKPKPSESFGNYLKRIDWKEDPMFVAIIAVGCTTGDNPVNQREFLQSVEDMADTLHKMRFGLDEKWKK